MKVNRFTRVYNRIEKAILNNSFLVDNVEVIALLGSISDKEACLGWSDLDILVILKSDDVGNIDKRLLRELKVISEKYSAQHDFPISILSHTIDDFENYVSFEYLKHYSQGWCTYPNENKLENLIIKILGERNLNDEVVKSYCLYHLRHIRFNLLRKYISWNRFNKNHPTLSFGKLLIDKMIKSSDLLLNLNGMWPQNKKAICNAVEKRYSEHLPVYFLRKALKLRCQWANISKQCVKSFIPEGLAYIDKVMNFVFSKYKFSTPEERMSQ